MLYFVRPVVQLAQCSSPDHNRRASVQAWPFPTFQPPFPAPKFMLLHERCQRPHFCFFPLLPFYGFTWTRWGCLPSQSPVATSVKVHYLLCRQVFSSICFKLNYNYFQSMSSPSNTVRFGEQVPHSAYLSLSWLRKPWLYLPHTPLALSSTNWRGVLISIARSDTWNML